MPHTNFKYIELAGTIEQWIHDEKMMPGDKVPGQKVIMEKFGASWSTVLKAMSYLAERGLIERKQGRATRVAERPTDVWETVVSPILQEYLRHGWYIEAMYKKDNVYLFGAKVGGHTVKLKATPEKEIATLRIPESNNTAVLNTVTLRRLASMDERGRLRIFYLNLEE